MASILIIDDNTAVQVLLQRTFVADGHTVTIGSTREEMFELIEKNNYDLMYLDVNLPDGRSDVDLTQILTIDPLLDIVIITGDNCLEQATKLLKQGAAAYMMKPFHKDSITQSASKLLKDRRLKLENRAKRSHSLFEIPKRRLMGVSEQMCRLNLLLQKIAKSPSTPVHLVGESGTGKELAAQVIHENSPRSEKPFIKVNCAAIPQHLVESELFGHEQGAFTDARHVRKGLFEIANGGTLFLDEIGDLHPDVQPKLLRVLEDGTYRRVGSSVERKADVRVISATNKDLLKLSKESGLFRSDLFYRLAVMSVTMPSLRHHPEDIEVIATAILREKSEDLGRGFMQFSTTVLDFFYQYEWPGNVRELRNMIERLIILSDSNVININNEMLRGLSFNAVRSGSNSSYFYVGGSSTTDKASSPSIKKPGSTSQTDVSKQRFTDTTQLSTQTPLPMRSSNGFGIPKSIPVVPLWELEKLAIIEALKQTPSKSECARQLGIARSTLLQKIEKYQISIDMGESRNVAEQ